MKKVLSLLLGFIFSIVLIGGISSFSYAQEDGGGEKKGGGGGGSASDVGINLSDECLTKGGNKCFQLDYLLWGKNSNIAKRNDTRTVIDVLQDVVLAATYMVGTVLAVVIIYCGLMYIVASATGKEPSKYRKGLMYAAIGAVLVRSAYGIVRLIQYIGKG